MHRVLACLSNILTVDEIVVVVVVVNWRRGLLRQA